MALSTVESTTYGFKLEFVTSSSEKIMLYSGVDYNFLNKDGTRERTMYKNPCSGIVFSPEKHTTYLLWQNSSTEDYGVFAEMQYFLNPNTTVTTGLRADFVNIIKNLNFKGNMNYTFAQNIEWNEPVAEITPFSSNLSLVYKTEKFKTELSSN